MSPTPEGGTGRSWGVQRSGEAHRDRDTAVLGSCDGSRQFKPSLLPQNSLFFLANGLTSAPNQITAAAAASRGDKVPPNPVMPESSLMELLMSLLFLEPGQGQGQGQSELPCPLRCCRIPWQHSQAPRARLGAALGPLLWPQPCLSSPGSCRFPCRFPCRIMN